MTYIDPPEAAEWDYVVDDERILHWKGETFRIEEEPPATGPGVYVPDGPGDPGTLSIVCLVCGRRSYAKGDIKNRFCAQCQLPHDILEQLDTEERQRFVDAAHKVLEGHGDHRIRDHNKAFGENYPALRAATRLTYEAGEKLADIMRDIAGRFTGGKW